MKGKDNDVPVANERENHSARLEALIEENRQLRLAADTFGRLAERLNDELRRLGARHPRSHGKG